MNLLALFYFVFSLFGCDAGRCTLIDRLGLDASGRHELASPRTTDVRLDGLRTAHGQCAQVAGRGSTTHSRERAPSA